MNSAQDYVEQCIAEQSPRIRAAVLAAVPRSEPNDHLYSLVTEYLERPGKAMRPLLCLSACRAYGGTTEAALGVGVAIELLHSAFLVHDDIEDNSIRRRGEPALHVRHGVPLALNAGDGLLALAMTVAAESCSDLDPRVGRQVLREFTFLLRRTVEGQATELGWIADARDDLSETDYLEMVMKKTCWYSTINPLRIGVVIGSNGTADLDSVTPFGFYLGATFQVSDDLANLASSMDGDDPYDKDRGGDILEGKRTLMLIHLLAHANESDRARVVGAIGPDGHGNPDDRIHLVLDLMERYGSIEHGRIYRNALAGSALVELRKLFHGRGDDPDVAFLSALTLHLAGADQRVHESV